MMKKKAAFMPIILLSAILLYAAKNGIENEKHSNTVKRNEALSVSAEIFENLSESAAVLKPEEFSEAMLRHESNKAEISSSLSSAQISEIDGMTTLIGNAWDDGDKLQVALGAIEVYRFLETAIKRGPSDLPLNVSMLDYSGFKLVILASATNTDWSSIESTTDDAIGWWRMLSPHVKDRDLRQAMDRTMIAFQQACKSRDKMMLIYAAEMDLILVDALENTFIAGEN